MSTDLELALQRVISSSSATAADRAFVQSLARAVESIGCREVASKVNEYYGKRLEDLCAELRLAQALSVHLDEPLDFQMGDAPDLRFSTGYVDCLVEVVHKSSPSPFATVFYPEPSDLDSYAHGPAWKQKAIRLHEAVTSLAVQIQPHVDGKLIQPCSERTQLEVDPVFWTGPALGF